MEYMRVWSEINIEDVQNHIIMVEDKFGHCPGCKRIGIELKELDKCPDCGRQFKYVTSKEAKNGRHEIVLRTKRKLPNLIFVDYDDYERIIGKKKAQSLFNV